MKASAKQATRISHTQDSIALANPSKRIICEVRNKTFFLKSVVGATILICLLATGSLLNIWAALYIGLITSAIILITGYGLDRRRQYKALLQEEDRWADFPTVRPSAERRPEEISYFVPSDETHEAQRELVLMARAPCSTLENVSTVTVATSRRPNGIRYHVKGLQSNKENAAILSLFVPDSDALGCGYHAKLRYDLLHRAEHTIDVELKYADGSVRELKKLAAYKSA